MPKKDDDDAPLGHGLSADQLAFFDREGYLIVPNVLRPEEVDELKEESNWILETVLNSSLYHRRHSGRLDWSFQTTTGQQMVRKIQPINDLSLPFTRTIKDPRIKDALHSVMGEKAVLFEEKLNYKRPLPEAVDIKPCPVIDDYFPVHNDWAYYRMNNFPQSVLSSALLIDDCTAENGPLTVYPGSHKRQGELHHLEHELMERGLQVLPEEMEKAGIKDPRSDNGRPGIEPVDIIGESCLLRISTSLFHALMH